MVVKKAVVFVSCLFLALLVSGRCCLAAEYFPLREGLTRELRMTLTQGDDSGTAEFVLTTGPKVNIDGVEAVGVTTTPRFKGGTLTRTFFQENETGVKIVAEQDAGDRTPKSNTKEEWEFKYPLAVGNSWTETDEVLFLKEKASVPVVHTIEKVDESVTVPAGTFEKCVRIRSCFSGKVNLGSYGGNPRVTTESTRWYAPGAGEIKTMVSVGCDDPQMGGGKALIELLSIRN